METDPPPPENNCSVRLKTKSYIHWHITTGVNVGGEVEVSNDNVNATMIVQSIPLIEKT